MIGFEVKSSSFPRKRISPRVRISPWLAIDSFLWAVMYLVSAWQRADFEKQRASEMLSAPTFLYVLVATVVTTGLLGLATGIYRGRFVPGSLLEATWVTVTLVAGAIVIFLVLMTVQTGGSYPRALPIVAASFTVLSALALRAVVRGREILGAGAKADAERVIVFGAGSGGRQLVKQLRHSPVSTYFPVALLDDDASKRGMIVEGVKVAGSREDLERVAGREHVGTLIIAVPSLEKDDIFELRDRAEAVGLDVLILPPLGELMTSRSSIDELREINVNDLLGRKPAKLNQTQIADYVRGRKILVTGAGGSIGSELCRQLARFRPNELMMLDRDESGLHATQLSLQDQAMLDGDDTILASIRDRETIFKILNKRRPDIVFHAAALKHMPLLEHYPIEAMKTNVIGTQNLLDAAAAAGVQTFVNISTDKAANPCSILGLSKRVAERLTAGKSVVESGKYVSVRFGNVLGSRGSVLTVFEKQIQAGGPVTITDPDVNRFFMTIPEACQLVVQAAAVGNSGDTLVLDMGEPVRIEDVARTLIEQSNKSIEIVYTGLRNNEKLSEELFDDSETAVTSPLHDALSIVRVPPLMVALEEFDIALDDGTAPLWMHQMAQPEVGE